jgi:hypothetical protein
MARPPQHFDSRAVLHNPARIHHDDPIGNLRNHSEIVRDKKQRKLELLAQLGQQFKNLFLYRNVERSRRLVGN